VRDVVLLSLSKVLVKCLIKGTFKLQVRFFISKRQIFRTNLKYTIWAFMNSVCLLTGRLGLSWTLIGRGVDPLVPSYQVGLLLFFDSYRRLSNLIEK
jgi:hypothetical protein